MYARLLRTTTDDSPSNPEMEQHSQTLGGWSCHTNICRPPEWAVRFLAVMQIWSEHMVRGLTRKEQRRRSRLDGSISICAVTQRRCDMKQRKRPFADGVRDEKSKVRCRRPRGGTGF